MDRGGTATRRRLVTADGASEPRQGKTSENVQSDMKDSDTSYDHPVESPGGNGDPQPSATSPDSSPHMHYTHNPCCPHNHASDDTFLVVQFTRNQVFCMIGIISTLVLVSSVAFAVYINKPSHFLEDIMLHRLMGPEAFALFRHHDYNNDGVLSAREFEPLAHILVEVNVSLTYELPIEPEDNMITVTSHFEPLDISTMSLVSKNVRPLEEIHEEEPLGGLLNWTKSNIEMENFAVKDFAVFLPSGYSEEQELSQLGVPYHISPYGVPSDAEDSIELRLGRVSSNRFYPPRVYGNVTILHNLLSMFHTHPFLNMRFPPRGAVASLRAVGDEWLDVVFRIHAEFQLNTPPLLPFWFTPAQFKGRLIISRDLKHIKFFNMQVPNNRRLNVDMEWLKGSSEAEMEVDIGYMPRMELRGTGPSRPATWEGKDMRAAHKPELEPAEDVLADLTWSQEVQVDVCTRAMEIEFYPFKTVPYYNYTEAYDVAAKEEKLIHSIVLWGALDDQSC